MKIKRIFKPLGCILALIGIILTAYFSFGVQAIKNPVMARRYASVNGFNNISLTGYAIEDGFREPVVETTISFFDNKFNFQNQVDELDQYYYDYGLDSEYAVITITDFTPFNAKYMTFNFSGFYRLVYIFENNQSVPYENFDVNNYISGIISVNELVKTIELYYEPMNQLDNGYNLELSYLNDYDAGYNDGYNEGYMNGYNTAENNIFTNPNSYGLYTQEQYDNNYNAGYNVGYNEGVFEDTPTGLEWFKSAISVTQAFLDIMILPNITLGSVLAGFVILILLKWILDWFRG